MANRFTDLEVEEVSFVGPPANATKADGPLSRVTLIKRATRKAGPQCRICSTSVADGDKYCKGCGAPFYKTEEQKHDMKTDEQKAAEQAEAQKVEAEKAAQKAAAEKAEADKAAEKAASEAVIKAQNEKIAKLERTLKTREASERVGKTMKGVPVAEGELAEKLVDLADKDADLAKFVEETLVKCAALIATGAVLEQKSKSAGESAQGTAIEKHAALVAKKLEENPKLNRAKAEAEVWRENPALYNEYLAEQK